MNISKIVGLHLKEARKQKGLTQTQVANIFNMTQQQYSRFENGVFELNYQQILDVCKLFEITPNELLIVDSKIIC
ncbi:MAG: helix-turn-helix transcriptional regulator [Clostridiales bacterium]|nr:helix-turn-helix transcriptional regulator [Clostridiales bacterium]